MSEIKLINCFLKQLKSFTEYSYDCDECQFKGDLNDWNYDKFTNELICPLCGSRKKIKKK